MSGEDAPRPYLENLIVPEIKTNKQIRRQTQTTIQHIFAGHKYMRSINVRRLQVMCVSQSGNSSRKQQQENEKQMALS